MSMQQGLEELVLRAKIRLVLSSLIILQIHHLILVGRHQPQVRMPDKDKLETVLEQLVPISTADVTATGQSKHLFGSLV